MWAVRCGDNYIATNGLSYLAELDAFSFHSQAEAEAALVLHLTRCTSTQTNPERVLVHREFSAICTGHGQNLRYGVSEDGYGFLEGSASDNVHRYWREYRDEAVAAYRNHIVAWNISNPTTPP